MNLCFMSFSQEAQFHSEGSLLFGGRKWSGLALPPGPHGHSRETAPFFIFSFPLALKVKTAYRACGGCEMAVMVVLMVMLVVIRLAMVRIVVMIVMVLVDVVTMVDGGGDGGGSNSFQNPTLRS